MVTYTYTDERGEHMVNCADVAQATEQLAQKGLYLTVLVNPEHADYDFFLRLCGQGRHAALMDAEGLMRIYKPRSRSCHEKGRRRVTRRPGNWHDGA